MKNIRHLLLPLLVCLSFLVKAQNYVWQHLTIADGLPSDSIKSLLIESDSSVWIGTSQGLAHYDGNTITTLYNNGIGGSNQGIEQIIIAHNKVWLITGAGISSYDGLNFANYNTSNNLLSNNITGLAKTSNGDLWIGSLNGVSKFDGSQFTHYNSIVAKFIEVDKLDYVYAINNPAFLSPSFQTAQIFDGSSWTSYSPTGLQSPALINEIKKNANDDIVFLTNSTDSYLSVSYPLAITKHSVSFPQNFAFTLDFDNTKTWAALKGGGRGFYQTQDSVFQSMILKAEFSGTLTTNTIKSGNEKVYYGTNSGILFIDKRVSSTKAEITFNYNQISTDVYSYVPLFGTPDNQANFEYPAGSGNHGIFAANFMTIAKNSNQGQWVMHPQNAFQREVDLGPINNSSGLSSPYMAKVSQAEINAHKQSFASPSYSMPTGIKDWPANGDSTLGIASDLAPFYDFNNNGCYDPKNGDYPVIKGDEAAYWINHSNDPNVPFEYHYMLYALSVPSKAELDQTLFVQLKIINRGQLNYDSVKTGIYVDGDLGNATDDYVGSDSLNNTFYFYNGDSFDDAANGQPGYGNNPPAVGVKTLSDSLETYIYYNQGGGQNGDPSTIQHWVNYLNAKWQNGQTVKYGGNGLNSAGTTIIPTTHMFTGDPDAQIGWTEASNGGSPNPPGDRRGLGSIPYYSLQAGGSKIIELAYAFGQKTSINSPAENVTEFARVVNEAKLVWDTLNMQSFTYASNFDCSTIVSVQEHVLLESKIQLYPNPTQGLVTLKSESLIEEIQVLNLKGQQVQQLFPEQTSSTLNLHYLSKGLYLLRIKTDGAKWESRKIIISD